MLKEFLNALNGTITTQSYTYPAANGISNVPRSATFKNFFSNLMSSFTSPLGSTPNQYGYQGGQQFSGGTPLQSIEAYRGIQNQFLTTNAKFKEDKRKLRALGPGSVFVNSPSIPPLPVNQGIQNPGLLSAFGVSPSYPTAGTFNGGVNAYGTPPRPGTYGQPFYPQTGLYPQAPTQGGGILSLLLFPIIGLVGLVTSLFKIKNLVNSFKPVEVNRDNTGYVQSNNYFQGEPSQEGWFNEFNPEEIENFQRPSISEDEQFLQDGFYY